MKSVVNTMRSGKELSRRDFLKLSGQFFLFMLGGTLYSTVVEPLWFDVENVVLQLPRLPKSFSGFRLVQISDIHAGEQWMPGYLDTVVEKLIAIEPDSIAITGDFVYSSPTMTDEILSQPETA